MASWQIYFPDMYSVMKSLGHEKIETTIIYMEKVLETDQHAIHEWEAENFSGYIKKRFKICLLFD